jgi:hypothetical protein
VTTLAVIHTATATGEPRKALAAEALPGATIVNFGDDSILPQLVGNGGQLDAVAGRVLQYARFAQDVGADMILEASSSIGELVSVAQQVGVPIVRIDEAMADLAPRVDVVVLAQASMARVLPRLPQDLRAKCLISPPLAIERVRQALAEQGGRV